MPYEKDDPENSDPVLHELAQNIGSILIIACVIIGTLLAIFS